VTASDIITRAADLIDAQGFNRFAVADRDESGRYRTDGPLDVIAALRLAGTGSLDVYAASGEARSAYFDARKTLSTMGGIGHLVEWANSLTPAEVTSRMREVARFADMPQPVMDHCDHCEQPTGRVMYGGVLICEQCRNQP
jgi:hypothetical protein